MQNAVTHNDLLYYLVMQVDKITEKHSAGIADTKIISIFLKTGAFSFGGWSTTVVLLEKELAKAIPEHASVDLKGAASYAQILPGATQVAIVSNVGYQLQGIKGALIATTSYLIPSISLIILFAWLYFDYLHQADVLTYFNGLIPALAGIILANAYRIGSKHVTHPVMWGLVIVAGILLLFFKIHALAIILVFGLTALGLSIFRSRKITT